MPSITEYINKAVDYIKTHSDSDPALVLRYLLTIYVKDTQGVYGFFNTLNGKYRHHLPFCQEAIKQANSLCHITQPSSLSAQKAKESLLQDINMVELKIESKDLSSEENNIHLLINHINEDLTLRSMNAEGDMAHIFSAFVSIYPKYQILFSKEVQSKLKLMSVFENSFQILKGLLQNLKYIWMNGDSLLPPFLCKRYLDMLEPLVPNDVFSTALKGRFESSFDVYIDKDVDPSAAFEKEDRSPASRDVVFDEGALRRDIARVQVEARTSVFSYPKRVKQSLSDLQNMEDSAKKLMGLFILALDSEFDDKNLHRANTLISQCCKHLAAWQIHHHNDEEVRMLGYKFARKESVRFGRGVSS